ncbi:MAG: hypothetical protein IJN80_04580 [Clostridia bacterium]|nr:hypothetical protein [Clostridia bacterium]
MTKKINLSTRIMSILLCFILLFSSLPAWSVAAASPDNTVVDPHTLDQWKLYFGVKENDPDNVELSTEYAGSVWTDKSVFDPEEIPQQLLDAKYNQQSFPLSDRGDNFLVALSAMASNKQIKGYSTLPTDTVFILDLSSSMRYTDDRGGSALDELAASANTAISSLLALNKNNRVAVVLYAGNTNKSFSAADGITRVLMPLDSYTPAANGQFLNPTRNDDRVENYALQVTSGVRNSAGDLVSTVKTDVSTGTFMQDGVYEAMDLLLQADPVVKEGVQAGTNRLPIMVLMTDGEPTLANPDYDGAQQSNGDWELGQSTMWHYDGSTADRNGIGHRDSIAFVTSLTTAFAKKQITDHYEKPALLYTLGYGSTALNRPEALSVLNPTNASAVQNNLWSDFLNDENIPIYRVYRQNGWSASATNERLYVQNAASGLARLSEADRDYVDRYFAANNDNAMNQAFAAIVNEIILQSRYYPTYVEGNHNHDGYLTFVDKIGRFMEISDVKGLVVGNRLFSGAALASALRDSDDALGTPDQPTAMGDSLIQSVKERLGISSTPVAQALVSAAYDHQQLYYRSDSEFSNYIGWFSDASGNFIDFWHEGISADQYPANATHYMKSYGFLGDTTVLSGVSNTDMMYMTVRIATEIATGDQILTWQIPASLIPTLTYEVEVEVDSDGNITRLMDLQLASDTGTDAYAPVRLLYEAELREELQDWNLAEHLPADHPKEDGKYVFYTNKWKAAAEDTLNAYSHFEPSISNERYYYTQNTPVLKADGTPYTGAKPQGSGYYHQLQVYEKLTDGTLRIHADDHHLEPISAEALDSAVADENLSGGWIIPKDVIHRYYDYERTAKIIGAGDENTQTMPYSDHPFVEKDGDIYYTYSTLGNNGKLTLAPATGIKLTKTLAEGYETNESFTFTIDVNHSGAQVVRLDANGQEESRSALPTTGEITLKGGETVYIIGLTAGDYTVSEKSGSGYRVAKVLVGNAPITGSVASLTLQNQTITPVEFTNAPLGSGDLVISKDVNYPEGFTPNAQHDGKEFTIDVAFTGDLGGMNPPAGAVANGSTYTLTLKDGDSATFSNIPEGVTYEVSERSLPAGYQLDTNGIRYSDTAKVIGASETDQAHVVNNYEPAPANLNLKVQGTKTVAGTWPAGAEFSIRLYEISDFSDSDPVALGNAAVVTESNPHYEFDFSDPAINRSSFEKTGTYYFIVAEEIPADADRIPDMAYDRSYGLFAVTIADANADGALEIADIRTLQGAAFDGSLTITKNFTNVVTKDIVYIHLSKTVADDAGTPNTDHLADITFGLFESQNATAPAYYVMTDKAGKATFAIPVTKDSLGASGKTYYLREIAPPTADRVVGMHYNEDWIGQFQIQWDDGQNEALTAYTPANGVSSPYAGEEISHTNTYEPNVAATLLLSGTKTLNGQQDLGGRSFNFYLYKTTAAFVIQDEQQDKLQEVTNRDNAITFNELTFTAPGLYYFSVKEEHLEKEGITSDKNHYHITVLVEKFVDNDGTTRLRIADGYPHITAYGAAGTIAPNALNFNNRYTISGSADAIIQGTKTLKGRPLLNGEFKFRLTEVADETGAPLQNPLILEAESGITNGDTAPFRFAPLTYTEEGTHYYKIEEIKGAENRGITYAANDYIVKVVVKDNGIGGLATEQSIVKSSDGSTAIHFTNSYKPAKKAANLFSTKELHGRVLRDGEFQFTILETANDFATPISGGISATVANDLHGNIAFPEVEFTAAGERYFLIEEEAGTAGGVVYDPAKFHVTVTATDNLLGALDLTTKIFKETIELDENEQPQTVRTEASSILFSNHYHTDTLPLEIGGTKKLTGRTLGEKEFKFFLYAVDESFSIPDGATPLEAFNAADGSFRFTPITIAKAGTYRFMVTEDPATTAERVTNDQSVYHLIIEVKDDLNGKLYEENRLIQKVGEANPAAEILFTNVYTPKPEDIKVHFQVEKKITQKGSETIGPEGFEFLLENTETHEKFTLKSDGLGKAVFTLGYGEEDLGKTYSYKLSEINTGKEYVTYSTAEYLITVAISMGENNQLIATLTNNSGAAEQIIAAFENIYDYTPDPQPEPEEPEVEVPSIEEPSIKEPQPVEPQPEEQKPEEPQNEATHQPQTGDTSNLALWFALLFVSGGIMTFLQIKKARR